MLAVASDHLVAIGSVVTPLMSVVGVSFWIRYLWSIGKTVDRAAQSGQNVELEVSLRRAKLKISGPIGKEAESEGRRLEAAS